MSNAWDEEEEDTEDTEDCSNICVVIDKEYYSEATKKVNSICNKKE